MRVPEEVLRPLPRVDKMLAVVVGLPSRRACCQAPLAAKFLALTAAATPRLAPCAKNDEFPSNFANRLPRVLCKIDCA